MEEEKYRVIYTDGVEDEEIFADQITDNLLAGTLTPSFNGTPTRSGYNFKGWSPSVTEKVSGNVTYTAQWEKISVPYIPDTKDNSHISGKITLLSLCLTAVITFIKHK